MSVITLPTDLHISRMSWGQRRNDTEFRSTFGAQALESAVPLWAASITVDKMSESNSGPWKTVLMQLKGRINQLALYDIARPAPRGTMRGTMTLSGAEAQGSTSLDIVTAYGSNSLTNPNNLAIAPWTQNIGGFWTSAASTTILGPDGQNANVTKFTVGASGSSLFTRQTGLSIPAGDRNASLYVYVPSGQSITNWAVGADWQDVETNTGTTSTVLDAWVRISVSKTLAATRNALDFNILFNGLNPVGGSGKFFYAAFAKEESGTTATDYGFGKTILKGDLLGLGSGLTQQVVMVLADATSTGQGNITVTTEPPLRNAFALAAAVTWDKPTALFRSQSSLAGWDYEQTFASGFKLDLLEDWRA